ncbi:MAG: ferritin-like domain-containing protein [Polyangiaceae bacterium]
MAGAEEEASEEIPASEAVRREWGRRVEAEYRSAAITQHLTLWLIQIAASPDLLHEGLRIVGDELVHAELSHVTFVAAGGTQIPPITRESLALAMRKGEPLEAAVTRWGVEVFCLGETVAVPLFKVLREGCRVAPARQALDRVLRDEVRHRDFGWTLLEYLVSLPSEPLVRELVEAELPGMFARLRKNYAPVGGEHKTTISDADRAWGLMPIASYREMLDRCYERDYLPRFERLGFDPAPAWQVAIEATPHPAP